MHRKSTYIILMTLLLSGVASLANAQHPTSITQGWVSPPDESRPRVWWHWLGGNITQEGVDKDLEWMQRMGIRGFQNFDGNLSTPQIVKNRLAYMSPEWKTVYRKMVHKADSLGMSMGIAGSPGWSESGGPWVTPEDAMKKLVWSEMDVTKTKTKTKTKNSHPSSFISHPSSVSGPFMDIPYIAENGWKAPEYNKDIMVLAMKMPKCYASLRTLNPNVTCSGGHFTLDMLTDGSFSTSELLPTQEDGSDAWIQYEFEKPQTIYGCVQRGVCVNILWMGGGSLQASDDGVTFRDIVTFKSRGTEGVIASAFSPVTARFFRLVVPKMVATPEQAANPFFKIFGYDKPSPGNPISEFNLYTVPIVDKYLEKAGYVVQGGLSNLPIVPIGTTENVIHRSDIIDITSHLRPDGTLDWTPPTSDTWKILRIGYSLTGHVNAPASLENTGLEVDKYDKAAVSRYFTKYLNNYSDASDGIIGGSNSQFSIFNSQLEKSLITDSWEAGAQNWTPTLPEQFQQICGYDMKPWMPALMGYVIDSPEATDKFLWDYRKTLGEMTVKNHYETLDSILQKRGMVRYSESHETLRALFADGMSVKRDATVPMAAMWLPNDGSLDNQTTSNMSDIMESASVAHVYGKKQVAAEMLTSVSHPYDLTPETLKPTADMAFSMGLTRLMLHSTVLQPDDDHLPGLALGPYGHWFNRHETWAEQAQPWLDYLSRCSYMLQQGKNVADILYYYGEDENITNLCVRSMPSLPQGYNYDFINPDGLCKDITVKDGKLVAPSGCTYRMLVIDPKVQRMSLPVLKAIERLANEGAVIVGNKPLGTPSLSDDEAEYNDIAGRLWPRLSLDKAMTESGMTPDVKCDAEKLYFIHRNVSLSTGEADIYWIHSHKAEPRTLNLSFRISGKKPQLWNPVTKAIEPLSFVQQNGRTDITLPMESYGSCFVVFDEPTSEMTYETPPTTAISTQEISTPWTVVFDGLGCCKTVTIDSLQLWNEMQDADVRYYSGTAGYTTGFKVKDLRLKVKGSKLKVKDAKVILDLGGVNNIAEVVVNGQPVDTLWYAPFQTDITKYLRKGKNTLTLRITNTWQNRIIGDQQPGADKLMVGEPVESTWSSHDFFNANSPLSPSGLLGPVKIITTK